MRTILLTMVLLLSAVIATAQEQTENPYAVFGNDTAVLTAEPDDAEPHVQAVPVVTADGTPAIAVFDFKHRRAVLINADGDVLASDTIQEGQRGIWLNVDPKAGDYPHVTPYSYCVGNPIGIIDPDGRSIYILFYTSGNKHGDEMFLAAAKTRKSDIEHSDYFDPASDIVILNPIQDISMIGQLVGNVVDTYSANFGETVEFSMWSHAGLDGPTGTKPTSANAVDDYQMSVDGWGNIDFNWQKGASANFYGCKTGVESAREPSFVSKVSLNSNLRDVAVHGQTSSAYPSIYVNVRKNTREMMNGKFSYPTYMVGGGSLGLTGRFFPTFSPANPMRTSVNGRSKVDNYYQPGRRYQ